MQKGIVSLSADDRNELQRRTRVPSMRAGDARRARLILMLDEGLTYAVIRHKLECDGHYISRWKKRFLEEGLGGLSTRHRGSKTRVLTAELQARILNATRRKPSDGSTHWSTRKLARHLGINHMLVARAWKRSNLKPHRFERYMASSDPAFEVKASDVIGLYLNPPQHAVVFCVDEKTAIQALDRTDPVLPLSPGRAERHGFEYHRHGTRSLYAAFNTASGTVTGKMTSRHTTQEFVAFLSQLVASQPAGQEIHIIADNLSAHKTKWVRQFLEENANVYIHYTPTYSSWLNQVELWFSRMERDVIHRGVFTSTKDLDRKILNYIRQYNHQAKPIKWGYSDLSRRISGDKAVT